MKQLRGIELKRFLRKIKHPGAEVYLLLENIQYARNVAGMFRTAEAFKVKKIFLSGISRKPPFGKDLQKASRKKEQRVPWEYIEASGNVINKFKKRGFDILGLEITDNAMALEKHKTSKKTLLVVGNETYGITQSTLDKLDKTLYIPMYGKGSSLNVGVACAVTLYKLIENYD